MSNIITVNTGSAIDGTLKAGRIAIATSASIDPTGFYNMINPAEGYTFITDPKVQGYNDGPPIIYPTQTSLPSDILATINGLPDRQGSVAFDNVWDALVWVHSTEKYFILNETLNGQVSSEVVAYWDASNPSSYPQSGSTIYDLSGNGNHFSLINGTSFDPEGYFELDGIDDYIKSTSTIDLTSYDHVVVDIVLKTIDDSTFSQAFEHSANWNANPGAFGLFVHNTGAGYNLNEHHTNHKNQIVKNYILTMDDKWTSHINLFTAVPDITGRQTWGNGESLSYTSGNGQTSNSVTFRNDTMYMGARGGTLYFNEIAYKSFKIYGIKFTNDQAYQNYFGSNIVTNSLAYKWDAGNLVSYDKSGTTTYNLAGSISGSLQNGVAYHKEFGGYWEFDGSNDRIILEGSTDSFRLDQGENYTVNAWVRTRTTVASLGQGPIMSNSSSGPVWSVFKVHNGHIGFDHYNNAWLTSQGTVTINDGEWHMLTWVNLGNGTMDLYVDGVLDTAGVDSALSAVNRIDVIGGSWTAYFDGDIANVQINEGTSFNANQVSQQYNAEYLRFKSSRDIPKEGLKIHYDLTDPDCYLSGTTVYDLSGNGNNGTVSNGAYFNPLRNGSIDVDGTDDYIITNFSGDTSTTSYTVINVMKSDTMDSNIGNRQSIFGFDDGDGIGYRVLCQEIWGNTGTGFVGDGSNYTYRSWSHSGDAKNITFYACVRTPTQIKDYQDGVLKTTTSNSNRVSAFTRYTIGERGPDGGNNWNGQIFYSLVYDRELSADEINRIYNTINTRFAVALPRSTTDSLELELDTGNKKSYSGTGTTWQDISGKGNGSTLLNSPTYVYENGGVLNFDGTNDYVQVNANGFGQFNVQTWTVEAWINFDTINTDHVIFSYDYTSHVSPYYATHMRLSNPGLIYLMWNNGSAYQYLQSPNNVISAGGWYHVVGVYESGRQQIFINGESVASSTSTNTITFYNQEVWIGRANYGGYHDGDIALVKHYTRALSPSEVLENYKSTRSRFGVDGIVTSNLVVHYDFSNPTSFDNSSTTVVDLGGSQNGTLINGMPFRSNNGGVVAFDGSNDYVDAGTLGLANYTILMWFKIDTTQTTFSAVGHRTFVGASTFRFQWDDNSTTQGRGPFIDFTGGGGSTGTSNTFSPDEWFNQWNQVGFSRTNGTVKMYWNGVNTQTGAITGQDLGDFEIGYDRLSGIGGADPINRDGGEVQLGDFMVYNDVLTDAEVLQNYNALKNRFGKD